MSWEMEAPCHFETRLFQSRIIADSKTTLNGKWNPNQNDTEDGCLHSFQTYFPKHTLDAREAHHDDDNQERTTLAVAVSCSEQSFSFRLGLGLSTCF